MGNKLPSVIDTQLLKWSNTINKTREIIKTSNDEENQFIVFYRECLIANF